jgi:sec-independent protein translocase protein TatB
MFDIGWSEMLMLAVLAVIVVGPKDLPQVLRVVGKWVGKARGMAREFQSGLEDIAREAELDQLKSEVNKAASEFEKAASETENDVRQSAEIEEMDPTGTSDNAFNMEEPASDAASGVESNVESESDAAASEWADRYASATAPAHSVAPAAPPENDEAPVEAGDAAAEPRTGT